MHQPKKHYASAIALLFAFAAVFAAGCGCDEEKEFSSTESCNMLVDAVNSVLTGCGQLTVDDITVCGYYAADCVYNDGCSPKTDVNTCVASIKALDCMNISTAAYGTLAGCSGVYANIAETCVHQDSSSSIDDWD